MIENQMIPHKPQNRIFIRNNTVHSPVTIDITMMQIWNWTEYVKPQTKRVINIAGTQYKGTV